MQFLILNIQDIVFTGEDFIIVPVLLLFFTIILNVAKNNESNPELRAYLVRGFWVKIASVFFSSLVFAYVLGKSDSYYYFKHGLLILDLSDGRPDLRGLLFFPELDYEAALSINSYVRREASYMVDRFSAFFSLITFRSFIGTTLCFAAFSYIFIWKFFKVLFSRYYVVKGRLALAFLYLPSVVMWGSPILKDTLTFAMMCLICYYVFLFTLEKRFSLFSIVLVPTAIYIIGVIKSYILLSLFPSLLLYFILSFQDRINSSMIRTILFPLLLLLGLGIGVVGLQYTSSTFTKFNLDNIEEKAAGTIRWHGTRSEQAEGSGYSLGSDDLSSSAVLAKFPLAINVTLFRPYLWEARKPLIVLAALESAYIFYLTLTLFFKVRTRMFTVVFQDSFALFCMVFSLLFSGAVGMVSYNFGALTRYKIPGMPFYIMFLALAEFYAINERKSNTVSSVRRR